MTETAKRKALYNRLETADLLGCDVKTLSRWVRLGTAAVMPIEGTKPPKWCAADVDALVAGRKA